MLNYCPKLCYVIELWCDLDILEYLPVYNNGKLVDENFKLKLRHGRWSYIKRCPVCGSELTGV